MTKERELKLTGILKYRYLTTMHMVIKNLRLVKKDKNRRKLINRICLSYKYKLVIDDKPFDQNFLQPD